MTRTKQGDQASNAWSGFEFSCVSIGLCTECSITQQVATAGRGKRMWLLSIKDRFT